MCISNTHIVFVLLAVELFGLGSLSFVLHFPDKTRVCYKQITASSSFPPVVQFFSLSFQKVCSISRSASFQKPAARGPQIEHCLFITKLASFLLFCKCFICYSQISFSSFSSFTIVFVFN